MKYIKIFEKKIKKLEFNVNDYVYISDYPDILNNFAKISKCNYFYYEYNDWDYIVTFFNKYDNKLDTYGIYIDECDIIRLMTEDEIELFNSQIDMIKYNL